MHCGGTAWAAGVLEVGEGERLPWNEYTCSAAARWGHLDVFKWARASGCPWDKVDCLNAADAGGAGGAAVRVWIQEQDEAVEEET
jgi:hypothetical protein